MDNERKYFLYRLISLHIDPFLELALEKLLKNIAYCNTKAKMDNGIKKMKEFLILEGNCKSNE